MLAAVVRLEGTLARADAADDGAIAAMTTLLAYGLPVLVVSDDERPLDAELAAALVDVEHATPRTLGAPPFSPAGLRAIADRLQLPPRRIYVISRDEMDIAAATLAGMPTILVGPHAEGPRAVETLAAAVAKLREPYGRAALDLRLVFEGFHARRRARRAAESDRGDAR